MIGRWHALILTAFVATAPRTFALDCKSDHFRAGMTMAALPTHVLARLMRDGPMADHGQAYLDTDVVLKGQETLPNHRFAIAAISEQSVIVAIEHGPLPTEVWVFDRTGSNWDGIPRIELRYAPRSLSVLVDAICGFEKSPR